MKNEGSTVDTCAAAGAAVIGKKLGGGGGGGGTGLVMEAFAGGLDEGGFGGAGANSSICAISERVS